MMATKIFNPGNQNYDVLARQPFTESRVTGACTLENENLQFCPIQTTKVSKALKCKLFPMLVLHLETSSALFQHTELFQDTMLETRGSGKKDPSFAESYRKVTSGLRNRRIWTSREVVRDCGRHFYVWIAVRYFDHSFINNSVLHCQQKKHSHLPPSWPLVLSLAHPSCLVLAQVFV